MLENDVEKWFDIESFYVLIDYAQQCWYVLKQLLACQNDVFKHVSLEAWGIPLPPMTTLHLRQLREVLGGCLGCWEALILLLRSSIFIHGVFSFLWLMWENIYELKVLMRKWSTIRACSNCKNLRRGLVYFLCFPFLSYLFNS